MATEFVLSYPASEIDQKLGEVEKKLEAVTLTSAEYDALEEVNANTLYMLTDGEEESIEFDATLSIEGTAADAKAVGDALVNKSDVEHTHEWDEILNRTHWAEEPVTTTETVLEETTYEFAEGYAEVYEALNLVDGAECTVTWDGVEYVSTCRYYNDGMDVYELGNPLICGSGEDNGQPFGIGYIPAHPAYFLLSSDTEATSHTVAITSTYTTQEFHKLDNRYIDAEWMAEPPTYETVLTVEETTVTAEAHGDFFMALLEADVSGIAAGSTVNLVLDGVEYTEKYNGGFFGNIMVVYGAYTSGCPCVGVVEEEEGILFYLVTEGDHTIALSVDAPVYKQLPTEYLPDGIEAAKLTNARTIQTNLGSTSAVSFDGSANVTPGVTGVLPVANGGTGSDSVDTTPTSGSTKMVTSGGVYEALNSLSIIPDASTATDGAFLRVVDGAWAAVVLPNAEDGEF